MRKYVSVIVHFHVFFWQNYVWDPIFYCIPCFSMRICFFWPLLVLITVFNYTPEMRVFPIVFHSSAVTLYSLFSFTLLRAQLGSPCVSARLKVSQTSTGSWGQSMKTFEHFVLWDIADSSASHWALNREAAQGFFFFITFVAQPPLPFVHHLISHTICIFYALAVYLAQKGRVVWAQSCMHRWMTEGPMLSGTCDKKECETE